MKWSVAVLMLVLVGCGARESELSPRSPVDESITITGPDGTIASDLRLRRDDYVARNRVSAPPADVVEALPAAFASVGLPEPEIDARNRIAIVQSHVVSRRLGSARMSSLLDCGRGLAGPYADSYRIHLTVSTQVMPEGENESSVLTRVEAIGQNTGGTSGNTRCSSTGQLESRIAAAIREAVD